MEGTFSIRSKSRFIILKSSIIANSVKLSTLFQESLRRISHILVESPWNVIVEHLSESSDRMRISRHNSQERWNRIRGSVMRWEEI